VAPTRGKRPHDTQIEVYEEIDIHSKNEKANSKASKVKSKKAPLTSVSTNNQALPKEATKKAKVCSC
jgi:hypothetical protein